MTSPVSTKQELRVLVARQRGYCNRSYNWGGRAGMPRIYARPSQGWQWSNHCGTQFVGVGLVFFSKNWKARYRSTRFTSLAKYQVIRVENVHQSQSQHISLALLASFFLTKAKPFRAEKLQNRTLQGIPRYPLVVVWGYGCRIPIISFQVISSLEHIQRSHTFPGIQIRTEVDQPNSRAPEHNLYGQSQNFDSVHLHTTPSDEIWWWDIHEYPKYLTNSWPLQPQKKPRF